MARTIWKGSLSFGLINIPINLYTGTLDRKFKFKLFHEKDLSSIRYARICEKEGKEVAWEDIVKGYPQENGRVVIMKEKDFERANVRKTKTIDILDFVEESDIETILFEKPYFLEPAKDAEKPYILLREALKKSKKVGIAKFVLSQREHVGVVRPFQNILLLDQLRYLSEIRSFEDLKIPENIKINPKELSIALKLIDQLTGKFNPKEYKDTYTEELKKMIKQKGSGKKIATNGKEPKPTNIEDLMSVLQESVKKSKRKSRDTKTKVKSKPRYRRGSRAKVIAR